MTSRFTEPKQPSAHKNTNRSLPTDHDEWLPHAGNTSLSSFTPETLMRLQSTHGNQFVQRLLHPPQTTPDPVVHHKADSSHMMRWRFEVKDDLTIDGEPWTKVTFSSTDILWHGNQSTADEPFKGVGQSGKSGSVKFVSNNQSTAQGYTILGRGKIYKMRLKRPVILAYSRDNFIDGPDVEKFCSANKGFDGMMLDYANDDFEIALAKGEDILEWVKD